MSMSPGAKLYGRKQYVVRTAIPMWIGLSVAYLFAKTFPNMFFYHTPIELTLGRFLVVSIFVLTLMIVLAVRVWNHENKKS